MINGNGSFVDIVLSVILFPTLFQEAFINFAWGATDPTWLMMTKRLFLLLPVCAIILGCWGTIACLPTVVVRQKRVEFLTLLLVTWWDVGKAIAYFWGGIAKFALSFLASLAGLVKILFFAVLSILQELIFAPFRLVFGATRNLVSSQVAWVAVYLTVFWCLIEALIFSYVTTPLVMDVFSNITGENLNPYFIRVPLFIFLLFVVMGSYAVLSTLVNSVKSKNVASILGIGAIEAVVLFVEVMFLYREFVDALVPWFAQYSENFELGVTGTLAIATFVWFGIRSLSWFLFASHGTPVLMQIIQGKGAEVFAKSEMPKTRLSAISPEFVNKIKEESVWFATKGEELLAAAIMPPLQVVACGINFCTLFLAGNHLFELPFTNMEAITNTRSLLENFSKRGYRRKPAEKVTEKETEYTPQKELV